MTLDQTFLWMQDSSVGHVMRTQPWLYPICQVLHFVGLSLLVGAIFIVDLRILGYLRRVPVMAFMPLVPVAIAGFAVNLITGAAFVVSDPPRFLLNPAFQLKVVLMLLAGINALWFTLREQKKCLEAPPDAQMHFSSRFTSALSILFWIGVIFLGRVLPVYAP